MIAAIIRAIVFTIFLVLHGYHDYKAMKYYISLKSSPDNKMYAIELNEHRYKAIINLGFCLMFVVAFLIRIGG